jgi:MYXO-CTERM domain-containing protein
MSVAMSYPGQALLRSLSVPRITGLFAALLISHSVASNALAGVEDWELSEVHPQSQGDPQLRFVELVNLVGGCLFPSSTLNLYDSDGVLLDIISLATVTTCYGAPTYLLLSTPEAAAYFGVDKDGNLAPELPSSGQLCFSSSSTHYDCVRWGSVTTPVVDLFGSSDTTTTAVPGDGISLSREQSSHVVIDDWALTSPTPRAPNDGSVWIPPDAGPLPDASPIADAGPPSDAARRSDSGPGPDARPDAQNTRYLDLDAVGGADCGCQSSRGQGGVSFLFVFLALVLGARRRRNS